MLNREDDLANGRTGAFAECNEVKVDPSRLPWKILPTALQMSADADDAYQKAKREGLIPSRTLRKRKRRDQRLKFTDPGETGSPSVTKNLVINRCFMSVFPTFQVGLTQSVLAQEDCLVSHALDFVLGRFNGELENANQRLGSSSI